VSKLLPDTLHPALQLKTLVLNLSGTLVETQYVMGKGLVVSKRPGLTKFLRKMAQMYEVVIFSDDDSMLIQALLPKLDPNGQIFAGYFGHECMVYRGGLLTGRYIKDLKYLNRDLKKVIVIDKSKECVSKQPENVI
jgi:TFIIF-interacting CTD phosphatase-like protein